MVAASEAGDIAGCWYQATVDSGWPPSAALATGLPGRILAAQQRSTLPPTLYRRTAFHQVNAHIGKLEACLKHSKDQKVQQLCPCVVIQPSILSRLTSKKLKMWPRSNGWPHRPARAFSYEVSSMLQDRSIGEPPFLKRIGLCQCNRALHTAQPRQAWQAPYLRDRNLRVYLEIEPGHPQLIAPSETVHACLVEGPSNQALVNTKK